MDLGFKRKAILGALRKADSQIALLRSKEVQLRCKDDCGSGILQTLEVSPKAKYLFVVVTDQNIPRAQFQRVEDEVGNLPNVRLFTLLRGFHPNRPGRSRNQRLRAVETFASMADAVGLLDELRATLA
jgi:hypothetical protein